MPRFNFLSVLRACCTLIVWAAFAVSVRAQVDLDRWTWVNPLPTGNRMQAITAGGDRFVAVGESGSIITSPDGGTWTATPSGVSSSLAAVAWNGTTFVAVGSNSAILTSPDGTTWTRRTAPFSLDLGGVVWGNNQFIAIGYTAYPPNPGTHLWTSPDGVIWTSRRLTMTGVGYSIAWNGSYFLMNGSEGKVHRSADGITWTEHTVPAGTFGNPGFRYLTWAGSLFLGIDTNNKIWTSPDGMTWTLRDAGTTNLINAVTGHGGRYIAVGISVSTSTDGATWSASTPVKAHLSAIAWNGRTFAAVGRSSIFTSADGLAWQPRHTSIVSDDYDTSALSMFPAGDRFLLVNQGVVGISTDGRNWSTRAATPPRGLRDVAFNGERFVAVGDDGLVASSPDAFTWTSHTPTTKEDLYRVVWGNNQFVAIGWGSMARSLDGRTWAPIATPANSPRFEGIAWGGQRFAVISSQTIRTSEDGMTWTLRDVGINLNQANIALTAIAWAGNEFVVLGTQGTALTSPDGLQWTRHNTGLFESARPARIAWNGSQYVALLNGSGFASSNDGRKWTLQATGIGGPIFNSIVWTGTRFLAAGTGGALIASAPAASPILGITFQPRSHTGYIGETIRLSVAAIGSGILTYQWRRDGVPLPGATSSVLNIPSAQAADAGLYDVVIASGATQLISSAARLTILPTAGPQIGQQPAATVVRSADALTLSVVASGAPPPTFQWRKDGVVIPGATGATYTILAARPSDTGAYDVVITNTVGTTTSRAATVTIKPAPETDLDRWSWVNPTPSGSILQHVIWTGTQFAAVGSNGAIITSDDGSRWTQRRSGVGQNLARILWTGSLFVTVGDAGTLLTSNDGDNWTRRVVATTERLSGLAHNAGIIVAVGENGTIIRSTDGFDWHPVLSGTTGMLYGITWANGQFIAVGGPAAIFTSPDGLTWTDRRYTANVPLQDIAWNGRIFVAVGGSDLIATSTNGLQWTTLPAFNNHPYGGFGRVSWDGSRFVLFGGRDDARRIFTSTDGTTWSQMPTDHLLGSAAQGAGRYVAVGEGIVSGAALGAWTRQGSIVARDTIKSLLWTGEFFVAVGGGPSSAVILTSADGANWVSQENTIRHGLLAIARSHDTFVATGYSGTIATSPDAITWTQRTSGVTSPINGVVWTGSHFVAAGREVLVSNDGVTWTLPPPRDSISASRLTWTGGRIFAFGYGHYTSRDGLAWQALGNQSFNDVVWDGGKFVGVGQGSVSTSLDGVTWTARDANISQSIQSLAWNGRDFVAPGWRGTIFSSRDGVEWTERHGNSSEFFNDVAWGADRFVVVGEQGVILTAGASRLTNLSVRSNAGSETDPLVAGFVLSGSTRTSLLLRAVGPTLSGFGVTGVAADPVLHLFSGSERLETNDDWSTDAGDNLSGTGARLGAFPLPAGSRDAAILAALPGASYSAQIASKTGSGIALAEIYEADASDGGRLVNVSARSRAGTGNQALIVGFTIAGTAPKQVLIRAIGPTLAQFGVSGVLSDPQLAVYREGSTSPIRRNDNWSGDAALQAAFTATGAFPLSEASRDAAILITLEPGVYSTHVTGTGSSTGVALVEVYELR